MDSQDVIEQVSVVELKQAIDAGKRARPMAELAWSYAQKVTG